MFSKHVCLILCYCFHEHMKLHVSEYCICCAIKAFSFSGWIWVWIWNERKKPENVFYNTHASRYKKIVLKANIRLKGFVWRNIYSFQFGIFSKTYILCVSNCVQIKNKIISLGIVKIRWLSHIIPALLLESGIEVSLNVEI